MEETKVTESPATPAKRGKGRPATGRNTIMIRIPVALKPAVEAMREQYKLIQKRHYKP